MRRKDAVGLLFEIDTENGAVVHKHELNSPNALNASLAIDEENDRIFVGCREPSEDPQLLVLDSSQKSLGQVTSVPLSGGIDDLFLDAQRRRLYASCGTEGFLVVVKQIDADHYKVLEVIKTNAGAATSLFEPATGRLYVAIPKQHPRIQVYQAL